VLRSGVPDDLPEMREEQRAPFSPVVPGLGGKLARPETLPLSRLSAPFLCVPGRLGVVQTSDPGGAARHEVAAKYSMEAHASRTDPLRHQFVDLPGDSLLHDPAKGRRRLDDGAYRWVRPFRELAFDGVDDGFEEAKTDVL
jgi:hypothetical protein